MTHPQDGRWIDATPARRAGRVLEPTQIESWKERGFAFVSGVFPETLIAELIGAALERVPAPGSAEAERITDFGSTAELNFPAPNRAFNAVTLHSRLLAAIAELLDVSASELRLTQSDLWPKYGRERKAAGVRDNTDQRIHVDYPNHTLVHPPPWDRPEAVELIVYLSDVDGCGGPTAVVPRNGPEDPAYRWPIVDSPGIADLDWVNDRVAAERTFARQRPALADWRASLYDREHYVRYRPGDVLFYRHDTWHRGTPMTPGALRLVQNMTYRRADAEWISTLHIGWAWAMYGKDKGIERLIAEATLDQRAVLGFPQPGSRYWTPETIEAVGMDVTPYREALQAP